MRFCLELIRDIEVLDIVEHFAIAGFVIKVNQPDSVHSSKSHIWIGLHINFWNCLVLLE